MQIVKYTEVAKENPFRYEVQRQSSHGTWAYEFGTTEKAQAIEYAEYMLRKRPDIYVRVVDMHE